MLKEFYILLLITVARQLPQYLLEYKNRQPKEYHSDSFGTVIFVLYVGIWFICLYSAYTKPLHYPLVLIGLSILLSGILLRCIALYNLRNFYNRTIAIYKDHRLVTNGVYGFVRHPLFLSLFIELLGMIIYVQVWYLLVLWALFIHVGIQQCQQEDEQLAKKFGGDFIKYKNRVPFMNLLKGIISRANKKV